MSPCTTRNESTPFAIAPRTSDSMARMFRSRVEQTTVGRMSGTSWVIRAAKAYGETRTCLNGLSVMSTLRHRPRSRRCVMSGRRGGLTSTISIQLIRLREHYPATSALSGVVEPLPASARRSRAAATMSPSCVSISDHPRVLRPQSGLTHRSAVSMNSRK